MTLIRSPNLRQRLSEAWSELCSDASWKKSLVMLPYEEKYDDPWKPSFSGFWSDKLKN